jgi:hypothetical protein
VPSTGGFASARPDAPRREAPGDPEAAPVGALAAAGLLVALLLAAHRRA